MENFADLISKIVLIVLDLISLSLVVVAVGIVALAIAGMARNRTAAWDNILYIPIVLFLGALLLQYYPPLVMKSVRMGVQGSRTEALLLRDEMQQWVPGQSISPSDGATPAAPADVVIDTTGPTTVIYSTPFPAAEIAVTVLPSSTPQPPPSEIPTDTPQPSPTSCVYIVHNQIRSCPPTPQY